MYSRLHIAGAAATLLFGSLLAQAFAQVPPRSPQSTSPGMPDTNRQPNDPGMMEDQQRNSDPLASDKAFVKQAVEGGMAEVELGKLAQEKSFTDPVKQFGKRMVEDHTKANEDLKAAAAKLNLETGTEVSRKVKKDEAKLSKLSGAEFDRAYAKMMLNEHKSDVKQFSVEARQGKIPEVKEFAANQIPTLQQHLRMAEQLEATTKSGPGGGQ